MYSGVTRGTTASFDALAMISGRNRSPRVAYLSIFNRGASDTDNAAIGLIERGETRYYAVRQCVGVFYPGDVS